MSGLDPSGDEGRELLRRELLRPEYNEQNPVLRFLDWLGRQLDGGLERASRVDPLVTAAGMVALLLVALGLIWLVARTRTERRARTEAGGVLDDVVETAAELRARAEAALAAGDPETALLEGFRALALRQVEAGRLADLPGATAREIADTLAAAHPAREAQARRAASAFDGVLYGGRRVGADVVAEVLALDDDLAGVR